ncbi:MAG: PspA/IM30 family protein [Deltaproteobacteria bacterium]|nr:PspA/IM30 family protein [Deltaproteobacteria bacterium]
MSWIESFTMIMRSNITTLQEKLVNPEKMVHQLIIDMDEDLVRVRHAVSKAIADEILFRKRADKAVLDVERWQNRAQEALERGDEKTAKTALERKLLADEERVRLEAEYLNQKTETKKLQDSISDLEEKIRGAKKKQTLLLARLARAESGQRINEALNQTAGRSALSHFRVLEERVDRAEAMSEAYDRLDGFDPDEAEIERQFSEHERKAKLEAELQAMKERLSKLDEEEDLG